EVESQLKAEQADHKSWKRQAHDLESRLTAAHEEIERLKGAAEKWERVWKFVAKRGGIDVWRTTHPGTVRWFAGDCAGHATLSVEADPRSAVLALAETLDGEGK